MMMGKSVENIYEKVCHLNQYKLNTFHILIILNFQKLSNGDCAQELTAEMANLEGIMKNLSAITAQQFEC